MTTRPVTHPLEILFGRTVALVCGSDGEIHAEEMHGLFAGDTRVLSTYRWTIAGQAWRLLSHGRPGPSTAQWDFQNPAIRTPAADLEEGTVHLRLRRRVLGALHDDVEVTSFADRPLRIRLALQLDADFVDVFQVKSGSIPPQLAVLRQALAHGVLLSHERRGFARGIEVSLSAEPAPVVVGAQLVFDVVLDPRRTWHCCVEAVPLVDGERIDLEGDPHGPDVADARGPTLECDQLLSVPFARGVIDLDRLAMSDDGQSAYVAAGAPWFMALFGRDTLVTSLMAALAGRGHAEGALDALARWQARARDDFRDAQPGKIAHELRRGELARFGVIPHTPYYGTHDAPSLYVLALWNAFRWTADRTLLERHLPAARAAMRWCEEEGDEDGDGLLEYRTRSHRGYRNQGWKDAVDAIPHADGRHAELPIATIELQGYWYAARLALAELVETEGDVREAARLRDAAAVLREVVEDRFWIEDEGCFALALDGRKHVVCSISSNPGHLLWCGLPTAERARRTADRLLQADMFSGYGIRTLAASHLRFNPLSYQLGSVWPHDNALCAAGLARYGLRDEAARVLRAMLDAAGFFADDRLPELFCGFDRDDGPPVPYERANVPQAWAAAAPILAAQILIGLVPDVPRRRCWLMPHLPEWLPRLDVAGIRLGDGTLSLRLRRDGDRTRIDHVEADGLDVAEGQPPSPLWGRPWRP